MAASDDTTMRPAESDAEIAGSFALMQELRPHLKDADLYLAQIRRQQSQGYVLHVCYRNDQPIGLAGYRLTENTVHGPFVYVDDLVVSSAARGSKIGATLLDAVSEIARSQGCTQLILDTGMVNSLAQRFYFRYGMLAMGMHFKKPLTA